MQHLAKPFWAFLILLILHQKVQAQHYFFVEAEGGQAFYMRIYDTLYSSTGEGFLIIPKVTDAKVSFTMGFPKGMYPEVSFELTSMDHDRGFLLKQASGNNWILIDRQSQEQYLGKGKVNPISSDSLKRDDLAAVSGNFANMLAEVTEDKTLLSKPSNQNKNDVKLRDTATSTPVKTTEVLPQTMIAQLEVEKFIPSVTQASEKSMALSRELVYHDNWNKGKVDTIGVIIEFPVLIPRVDTLKTNPDTKISDNTASVRTVCNLPSATVKDIRTIQKKLLGLETEEDQLNYIEKTYNNKCFTVDQTKEIGWFFRDESVRLKLFTRILPLLSDRVHVVDLGVAFFKEENVRAFKALISQ